MPSYTYINNSNNNCDDDDDGDDNDRNYSQLVDKPAMAMQEKSFQLTLQRPGFVQQKPV